MLIAVQLWVHIHARSDGVFWWGQTSLRRDAFLA